MSEVHPFQAAGLGLAPYVYIGMIEKVCSGQPNEHGVTIGYAGQPAGTCDYCGQGIRYVCRIRSADGREFGVGCDCVLKLEREDNRLIDAVEQAQRAIKREQARKRAEARMAREAARIRAAVERLEAVRPVLASCPHPYGGDRSAADYVDWLLKHAGHSGRLRAAQLIEKA